MLFSLPPTVEADDDDEEEDEDDDEVPELLLVDDDEDGFAVLLFPVLVSRFSVFSKRDAEPLPVRLCRLGGFDNVGMPAALNEGCTVGAPA